MHHPVAQWKDWRSAVFEERRQSAEALQRAYQALVSPRTGLLSHVGEALQEINCSPLRLCTSKVGDISDDADHMALNVGWRRGAGASLTLHEAMLAAIAEVVERLGAVMYSETDDIVWASYNEVKEHALSPELFALPSEADIARFPNHLKQFDPEEPLDWARGWSLLDGVSLLVPAAFVYATAVRGSSPSALLSPGISTGLAAGPNAAWAVLRGLCECIERDAFMITYLNRLPVPEIDLELVDDLRILDVLQRIRPWHRCRVRAWSTTTDIGVPSILVVITSLDDSLPAVSCGSATHPDPVQALRKAMLEAWHTMLWLSSASELQPLRSRRYASDFHDVLERNDQLALATQPHYKEYLQWLLCEREKITLESLPDLSGDGQELERVVAAVKRVGLSVVVSDVTTYEAEQAGLHVCRVLIPGAQPLTLGPVVVKSHRLFDVPRHLGYTTELTTLASLNPVPHPFP